MNLMIAAAAMTAQAPAPAAPASDQNGRDARCLIVSSALTDSDDAEVRTAGLIAAQYYLGRIDGRSPGVDLEALLIREAERLPPADQQALLTSCGAVLEQRGKALEAIGDRMTKMGR